MSDGQSACPAGHSGRWRLDGVTHTHSLCLGRSVDDDRQGRGGGRTEAEKKHRTDAPRPAEQNASWPAQRQACGSAGHEARLCGREGEEQQQQQQRGSVPDLDDNGSVCVSTSSQEREGWRHDSA